VEILKSEIFSTLKRKPLKRKPFRAENCITAILSSCSEKNISLFLRGIRFPKCIIHTF
jgi:hypothetical protein